MIISTQGDKSLQQCSSVHLIPLRFHSRLHLPLIVLSSSSPHSQAVLLPLHSLIAPLVWEQMSSQPVAAHSMMTNINQIVFTCQRICLAPSAGMNAGRTGASPWMNLQYRNPDFISGSRPWSEIY